MSEKANYAPEPQTPAPPSYEHPTHTAPLAEQSTQQPRLMIDSSPVIQLQTISPQQNVNTPPPSELSTHFDPPNPSPQIALHKSFDCPVCGQREMTRPEGVTGKTTHGWAGVLCFCACVGCIPYFASAFKDVNHMCGKCGHVLATYHNSGHVEVHKQQAPNHQTPE
ncbi:LITAF-like zinc ribbon domain-containing protein [Aspergillus karnatakaensis]|uniref:LITAF-like zinc ribbon domain-containing protein n=1 Tax=Aspergillus karnatakaensis TaxID=1810916 RepID=UPI003CCD8FE7